LTLEASRGATLVSVGGAPALTVRDMPDVTIRGLALRAATSQHALLVDGATTGLRIEGVTFSQAAGPRLQGAVVRLTVDPRALPGAAVLIRRCRVENQGLGVSLLDPRDATRPVGGVQLEDNVFSGRGVHVLLAGPVGHVVLRGNRFLGGMNGVNLDCPEPSQAEDVVIANNTFFGTTYWIGLVRTDARQKGITVCNNLVVDSRKVEWSWKGQLDEVARAWAFRANELHRDIALRSRDPGDPDFLRPEPGSALATSGVGREFPSYIGALAPRANPAR
jgi:hypothetical protein